MSGVSKFICLLGRVVIVAATFSSINCSAENTSERVADEFPGSTIQAGEAGSNTNNNAGMLSVSGTTNGNNANSADFAGNDSQSDEICADQDVQTSRIIPWILFVIDRSSSMNESYPGSANRWQAVYDALMAPNEGVIARLHQMVEFGIMLYDGEGACPRLVTVDPVINNYDPINAVYGTSFPGRYTPTAVALNAAYAIVPDQQAVLETRFKPHYVVLCTDGQPNGCPDAITGGRIETDFQGPIDEVTAAAAQDIKTFVVSVASGGQEYQNFLDQLAVIGDTGSPAFSPTTKDELVARFAEIVGGAIGCEIGLNGTVTQGSECSGTVELNGNPLECNGPDGWRLADPTHIELLGQACDRFMSNPDGMLSARFPCGVVVIE